MKGLVFIMVYAKAKKHIEIVTSGIPALSSMGNKSRTALYKFLKTRYTRVGVSLVDNLADLERLVARRPDLVFMGMKYVPGAQPGTKVWVSDYLVRHGINHTGSTKRAIELEQDKSLAKQRVAAAGITTSGYAVVSKGDVFDIASSDLRYPLFVKPSGLGAGQGVDDNSVVHDAESMTAKVASLRARLNADALIEEFLPGREYSVAILKLGNPGSLVAMPLELLPAPNGQGHRILSHELKTAPLETPVFPVADPAIRSTLIDLAIKAFVALGARDYGRIDIRMDANGIPHFLEANLIPCIIEGSGNFPKACVMNIGMGYGAMVQHIVQLALARAEAAEIIEPKVDPINSPVLAPLPA
jgi:D-alanine-D-alanine ligase